MKLAIRTARQLIAEDLNFLLTNRVPRIGLTRLLGWYSRIENPLLARLSIALWRRFGGLDLAEARETRFNSVRACFTRELKPGLRPIDAAPEVLVSPCDAIVGACGKLAGVRALQAKGLSYRLPELLGSEVLAERYRDGHFVTLRLSAAMYHRFHAPGDGRVRRVTHITGDTWNVNPVAVARVERLFCRNERAVLQYRLDQPSNMPGLLLVPVAAVGVACLRLHCIAEKLGLDYRGPQHIDCNARYRKGAELGWFELGSTIIVIAPPSWELADGVHSGVTLRMGQRLLVPAAVAA
jgi:phosphatidylserine decarboxylase